MNDVSCLLGARPDTPLPSLLAELTQRPAWRAFDPRAVAFVARLSQKLLTSPGIRQHPELAALGHWFRGANLRELAQARPSETQQAVTLGRGLAFHVAPSNVDSVFMYSWLLSLLAGNVNLVRLSQQTSPAVAFLIDVLRQTLDEAVGEGIRERIVLITYPHDAALTQAISEACQLRVVWGGDATVQAIRAIPLRPTATEVCFPDRFSACALRADTIVAADDAALRQLATGFYNDAFWFGQQACSSPRMVAWVGSDADIDAACDRFWPAVTQELLRRQPPDTEAMNMARVTAGFEFAASGIARPTHLASLTQARPARLSMEVGLNERAKALHCGNGLFLETRLRRLSELATQLSDKEQTLAVHGFERSELLELVTSLPPRAIDRMAPIGQALAFAPVWDGVDLLTAFGRQLLLPPH